MAINLRVKYNISSQFVKGY